MQDLAFIALTIAVFAVLSSSSRGSSALSASNWIGLIVGIGLTIYLFLALVLPERF